MNMLSQFSKSCFFVAALWAGTPANADEPATPPALTFSGSLTGFSQALVASGGEDSVELGGKLSFSVNADGQRLGLWPGFSSARNSSTTSATTRMLKATVLYYP